MQLYRKLSFGRLAEFLVLDTPPVSHRPAQRRRKAATSTKRATSPKNTMLGQAADAMAEGVAC